MRRGSRDHSSMLEPYNLGVQSPSNSFIFPGDNPAVISQKFGVASLTYLPPSGKRAESYVNGNGPLGPCTETSNVAMACVRCLFS